MHPQAIRNPQHVFTDHAQRAEIRQLQRLNAVVVAFHHEQHIAEHGNAIGATELQRPLAGSADRAQALTGLRVVDHQAVAGLGGGDQPSAAVFRGPDRK